MSRYIIDVREPEEYERGHVDGAINIPAGEIRNSTALINDIPIDAEIILYCVSGSRSHVASAILAEMGYKNVKNGINKYHVESFLKS